MELKLPYANDGSEPHVPTRTIGELSSGTQLGPPLPSPVVGTFNDLGHERPHTLTKSSSVGTLAEEAKVLSQKNPNPPASSSSGSTDLLHAATSLSPVSIDAAASCLKSPVQGTPAPSLRRGLSAVFEPPIIVLVVDDDRLTRTIMSRTLSRLGCHVSTAENGEVALEMIVGRTFGGTMEFDDGAIGLHPECNRYDVVFLDNQMPIMSGLEVVSKLREMGRQDFVVGVTGKILFLYPIWC